MHWPLCHMTQFLSVMTGPNMILCDLCKSVNKFSVYMGYTCPKIYHTVYVGISTIQCPKFFLVYVGFGGPVTMTGSPGRMIIDSLLNSWAQALPSLGSTFTYLPNDQIIVAWVSNPLATHTQRLGLYSVHAQLNPILCLNIYRTGTSMYGEILKV